MKQLDVLRHPKRGSHMSQINQERCSVECISTPPTSNYPGKTWISSNTRAIVSVHDADPDPGTGSRCTLNLPQKRSNPESTSRSGSSAQGDFVLVSKSHQRLLIHLDLLHTCWLRQQMEIVAPCRLQPCSPAPPFCQYWHDMSQNLITWRSLSYSLQCKVWFFTTSHRQTAGLCCCTEE